MGKLLNFLKEMPHRIFHYWTHQFFFRNQVKLNLDFAACEESEHRNLRDIHKCHKVTCLTKDLALDVKGSENIPKNHSQNYPDL